jgi:hypothetical protein
VRIFILYIKNQAFYPVPLLCHSGLTVGFSEDDALLFWFLLDLKKMRIIRTYQFTVVIFAKIAVREKYLESQ